jgi:hypothetical protein
MTRYSKIAARYCRFILFWHLAFYVLDFLRPVDPARTVFVCRKLRGKTLLIQYFDFLLYKYSNQRVA